MKVLSIFILAIVSIAVIKGNPVSENGKMIGGTPIDVTFSPYIAKINYNNSISNWGGFIYNNRWIITAPILQPGLEPSRLQVTTGTANLLNTSEAQIRTVNQIHYHPEFNASTRMNRIALLELSSPLTFNDRVNAAKIGNYDDVTLLTLVGWESGAKNLRMVDVHVLPDESCANSEPYYDVMTQVCARVWDYSLSIICSSDEGSPLVQNVSDPLIVGLVSHSYRCNPGDAAFFTRVGPYLSWIEGIAGSPGISFSF